MLMVSFSVELPTSPRVRLRFPGAQGPLCTTTALGFPPGLFEIEGLTTLPEQKSFQRCLQERGERRVDLARNPFSGFKCLKGWWVLLSIQRFTGQNPIMATGKKGMAAVAGREMAEERRGQCGKGRKEN